VVGIVSPSVSQTARTSAVRSPDTGAV